MKRCLLACLVALSAVGVSCPAIAVTVSYADSGVRLRTPQPPYPYVAMAKHLQGICSLRVTFDERGKAVKAEIVKSTGHSLLDDNAVRWALAHWVTTGGKWVRFVIPVTYRLR